MQQQKDAALPVLHQALEIFRTHGNDLGAANCLERIGEIQRLGGQEHKALSTLEEAVAVASRSGDRLGVALALRTMGSVHVGLGNFDRAAEAFSEALPIAQSVGWYAGLSSIGKHMGRIKMKSGDYHEAETLFQDSVSVARQGTARWELAQGLNHLGECFHKQSKLDEAASALGEACLLFQEISGPQSTLRIASTLVELKRSQGDREGALFWHDHIITVSRSQKWYEKVAEHLQRKGLILVKAQRYDEAALHFEAAILTRMHNGVLWSWARIRLQRLLSAIPKTVMEWERRLPLLCDLKKLQRRQPQLTTATLKLPIPSNSKEP